MNAIACIRDNVVVTGPRVVTAGHPSAATAGALAFGKGGNAFDAALAACFMEHIALPMKCGLAGDLVALVRRNGGAFESLISIGAGARALAEGQTITQTGPRSVGVPGAPHGYALLHGFARLGLKELIQPAVRASRGGIAWTQTARSYVVEAKSLLAEHSPDNPYAPGGRIPAVGELRRLPGLGILLEAFCDRREALFDGEIGARISAYLQEKGGIVSAEDFRQRPGTIRLLKSESLRDDARLSVTPLPTHGTQLIETVIQSLRGEDNLVEIVRRIRKVAKARGQAPDDGGTSVVTAADDEGNAAVIVHSNSFPQFASGMVVEGGLILNNRAGRGFDLSAPSGARNAPAAGKTPWTTLHAWCLEQKNSTVIGATPGGVNQLCWNAQSVAELLAGADVADIVTNPRWALDARDVLTAEAGTDSSLEVPHHLDPLSLRSVQQAIRLSADGGLHRAAADPRTGASALAVY